MFFIRDEQMNAFQVAALSRFGDEMVCHIERYFPNHFVTIGEEGIRNTIKYGYSKAKNYGFTTKRNVCLYLNNMLLLGSNFDCDDQYPWARWILNDKKETDAGVRVDKLSDKAIDIIEQISGTANQYTLRMIISLCQKADEIFERLISSDLSRTPDHFNDLFTNKFKVVGEDNLKRMTTSGIKKAAKYGFVLDGPVLIYIMFMYILGSGFDEDPQFSWAKKILNDPDLTDEKKKAGILYYKAIGELKFFLSQYNKSNF